MLKSFADPNLEDLWEYGINKKIKSDLAKRVLMKMDMLDAACSLTDLKSPPSNHLHKLVGQYTGCWVISVNAVWRLVFEYRNGNIYALRLLQYH